MAKFKEQNAYDSFKSSCIGELRLERIENMLGQGMPDVIAANRIGTTFWLELKAIEDWPKRATTLPLKGAFEKGQLAFMASWITGWKGYAFVLLRVGKEYILLRPFIGLGLCTKEELLNWPDPLVATGKDAIIQYLKELE